MAAPKRIRDPEALEAKRFEVNELFTPSAPVSTAELFAGRFAQLQRILASIAERGRHVLLFGERGVGKTSLARIVQYMIPAESSRVKYARVQAFPTDDFNSIAKKLFKHIHFTADYGEGDRTYDASQMYPGEIGPDDFIFEFSQFSEADIPVFVIDEFNEISDPSAPILMANVIKALSDSGSNVTLIIVGVADNVSELIKNHESIQRCTEEILMPRMHHDELNEVLDKRIRQLELQIDGDAKWKIINLAKGLPAYVHGLGKFACLAALDDGGRTSIVERDVDTAVEKVLMASDQSFKDAYEAATRSNQPGNLLQHVLTACALAKTDESGYFTPASVKDPLSNILSRPVEIANFQNHLKAFIDPKRRSILHRIGEQRAYRFRFRQPAMQPYILMKGITDGIIDKNAKRVLSYPEQPDLFSNEIQQPA